MSDPFDPRFRTPDARAPRASDGYAASRGVAPGDPATPPASPVDPIEALLASYAQSTDVAPAPDLSRRIHARISREPARTPPRRFLVALAGLRLTQARDAFGQTAGVAFGRGRFPVVVRGQALALVALTVVSLGAAAFAGAVGVNEVVTRIANPQPVVRLDDDRPSPSPLISPSPWPSPSAMPSPSPSAVPSELPSPSDGPETQAPETDGPHPSTGPDSRETPDATERPTKTHDGGGGDKVTPRPTRTPRPTPKDTPRPTRTPTPRPTQIPEPTDDSGGGGGGGTDHGGGGDNETPEPAETPEPSEPPH